MLPSTPRVVIVDADRRVLQSLSDLLGVTGEVEVVGRAGDVRAALEEVERESPRRRARRPSPSRRRGRRWRSIGGMARAWPSLRIVLTGWGDTEGHVRARRLRTTYVSKGSCARGVRRRHRRRLRLTEPLGRGQSPIAARIASSSGGIGVSEPSSAWTASGSFSPWPVSTQTTVSS